MNDRNCPSPAELENLVQAQLSESRADQVLSHVAECPACEETVVGLEKNGETIFDRVPPQAEPLPFQNEPELQHALEDAKTRNDVRDAPQEAGAGLELTQLRDYRILEKVGEGGMGAVYRAVHTRLKKMVAIKVLSSARVKDRESIVRFEREMSIIGRLQHPHIVQAFDAGEEGGRHFLVMEFVEGPDLSNVLQKQGRLSISAACEVIRQAALGLQYAHENGLVHRDIKPSNLVLARPAERSGAPGGPPTVKILDLGLARWNVGETDTKSELTTDGQIMGTLDYMAPEQGGDSRSVDIRADIYSLGATLFKLLTGDVVFGGPEHRTMMQKLQALALQPAPSIQTRLSAIPAPLAKVIDKMLAKRPEDRYETPAQVAVALAPFTRGADLGFLVGQPSMILAVDDAAAAPDAPTATISGGKPGRDVGRLVRWALLGAALLGALMVIGTKKGVVEIETPEGALPADLRIAVTNGGEVVEILQADNKWTAKVVGGEFQVALLGGDDRFELAQSELKVNRFGKNIVTVRIKPMGTVAKTVPTVPAAPGSAAVPPATSGDSKPPVRPAAPDRPRPYVVVDPDGKATGDYQYLTDALEAANETSVIEVHGNGPFRLPPLTLRDKTLRLRNGQGFHPQFIPTANFEKDLGTKHWLTLENVELFIDGCDFSGVYKEMYFFVGKGGNWSFRNCRLVFPADTGGTVLVFDGHRLQLDQSLIVSHSQYHAIWIGSNSRLECRDSTVLLRSQLLMLATAINQSVHLERNLVLCDCPFVFWNREANAARTSIESTDNLYACAANAPMVIMQDSAELKQQVDWKGQGDSILRIAPLAFNRFAAADAKGKVLANAAEWNEYWQTPNAITEVSEVRFPWDRFADPDRSRAMSFVASEVSATRGRHPGASQAGPDVNEVGPGAAYDRAQQKALGAAGWSETPLPGLDEGPVVLLRDSKPIQGFLSLEPAVLAAQSGDIIEIRSNGTFERVQVSPVEEKKVTIRAGAGYQPKLTSCTLGGSVVWTLEGLHFLGSPGHESLNGFVRRLSHCSFAPSKHPVTLKRRPDDPEGVIEIDSCYLPGGTNLSAPKVNLRNSVASTFQFFGTDRIEFQLSRSFLWCHAPNLALTALGLMSAKEQSVSMEDCVVDTDWLISNSTPLTWRGLRNVYRVHGSIWGITQHKGKDAQAQSLEDWRRMWGSDADSVAEESAVRQRPFPTAATMMAATASPARRPDKSEVVSAPAEKKATADRARPYVVVTADGMSKGEFRYLTEALNVAGADSVIEVHGNGPFRLPAVEIRDAVLKIRNGKGYRPQFIPVAGFGEGQPGAEWFKLENLTLSVEGCDFIGATRPMTMFAGAGPDWSFRDCRLILPPCRDGMVMVFRGGHLNLAGSLIVSNSNGNIILLEGESRLTVKNCRILGAPFLQLRSPAALRVTLENNLLVGPWHFQVWNRAPNAGRALFESTNNLFAGMSGSPLFLAQDSVELNQLVEWRGRGDRILRLSPAPLFATATDSEINKLANAKEWNEYWQTPDGLTEYADLKLPWDQFVATNWRDAMAFFTAELESTRSRQAGAEQVGPDVTLLGPGAGYDRAQRQSLGADSWPEVPTEGLEEGPVVLLRAGKPVRGFLSLTPAIEAAQDGDIIEIRSSSLFDPVQLISPGNRSLTLRAGAGHQPRIPWLRLEGEGVWSIEGLQFVNPPDREPLIGFVRRLAHCSFENTKQPVTLFRRPEDKDRSVEIVGCYLPMPVRYHAAEVTVRNSVARSIETADIESVVLRCDHCFFWSHDVNMACLALGPISSTGSQMMVKDTLFDADTLMISKLPHAWQGRRNVYRLHGAAWASMEQDGQVHSPGDLASWRKLMGSDEDSVAEESAVRRGEGWHPDAASQIPMK